MTTTPGKATLDEANRIARRNRLKAWNALSRIAPSRELELAEALPELVHLLQVVAGSGDYVNTTWPVIKHRQKSRELLAKLGLNASEGRKE